jgi:hypothetical protein
VTSCPHPRDLDVHLWGAHALHGVSQEAQEVLGRLTHQPGRHAPSEGLRTGMGMRFSYDMVTRASCSDGLD